MVWAIDIDDDHLSVCHIHQKSDASIILMLHLKRFRLLHSEVYRTEQMRFDRSRVLAVRLKTGIFG